MEENCRYVEYTLCIKFIFQLVLEQGCKNCKKKLDPIDLNAIAGDVRFEMCNL